jgi:hypothetical protein
MYPINVGKLFAVQQKVTGGAFTGQDQGRAGVTLSAFSGGSSQLRLRARRYGLASNVYTVQLIDLGSGINQSTTKVELVGTLIKVTLRRSSVSGILATPTEVADAINNVLDYTFPVRAEIIGSGSPLAQAVVPTALTGGLDPIIRANESQYIWDLGATDQGFFHFEQEEPITITQIGVKFLTPPSANLEIKLVNLNSAFSPITNEDPRIITHAIDSTNNDYWVSRGDYELLPQQALQVLFNASGYVTVYAIRSAALRR